MHTSKLKNSEKPYERFLYAGPEALSDAELLAIILRTGTKGIDAVSVAKSIIQKSGVYGLSGLYHLSIDDLQSIPGIGPIKAIKLKCIGELANRIAQNSKIDTPKFQNPGAIAAYYMPILRHCEKEKCICAFLDTKMAFIQDSVISVGSINASLISTREILIDALNHKAVYIVLIHNHPSGNPTPSSEDREITFNLLKASQFVNIPLVDHIIIGDNQYYSFKENNDF